MPDLVEVEVTRAVLQRETSGKKVKAVTVASAKAVSRHKTAKDFRTLLEDHILKEAMRLGDSIVIALDNGHHLVIDLASGVTLQWVKDETVAKPKYTQIVLAFATGGELRIIDPKQTGVVFVSKPPLEGDKVEISKFARLSVGGSGLALRRVVPELAPLGLDPLEDQIGWDRFAAVLRSRSTPLVEVFTDQSIFSGIGSLYASEIFFAAGLRPDRPADGLSTIEMRRLHRSILEILADGIKHGGVSTTTSPFTDPDGVEGDFQRYLKVWEREGERCEQCRSTIKLSGTKQKPAYYCEKCQA
jgi:formamidopyrimidine-DNA glycosylase